MFSAFKIHNDGTILGSPIRRRRKLYQVHDGKEFRETGAWSHICGSPFSSHMTLNDYQTSYRWFLNEGAIMPASSDCCEEKEVAMDIKTVVAVCKWFPWRLGV